MTITELEKNGKIIFKTVTGSYAYNLNVATSDIDYRGLYMQDKKELLSLRSLNDEVDDDKQDEKYYSLRKFFMLAKDCNPNIIELLYMPGECIQVCHPIMQKVINNRGLFISKKAKFTFAGYAHAQIKRASGTNRWVNNSKSKEKPKKIDFVYIINNLNPAFEGEPGARPVKYLDFIQKYPWLTLDKMHCAALEHTANVYRLYNIGSHARGIFRNGQFVCESITIQQEFENFIGLMIYDEIEYKQQMKDWHNYWEWVKNRNDARWVKQESGELSYDVKDIMHCMRLLYSGINILKNGEPIIKFTGDTQKLLMGIRNGDFDYEYLMKATEEKMAEMEELYKTSTIPHTADFDAIDALYQDCLDMWEKDIKKYSDRVLKNISGIHL